MPTVDPDAAERFVRQLFRGIGSPDHVATQVANSLTMANLRGHDFHGIRRALQYYDFLSQVDIETRITALHKHIRSTDFDPTLSSGVAAYGDEAYLPGEPEHRMTRRRREQGIPVPDAGAIDFVDLAITVGTEEVTPPAFESVRQ